MKPHIPWPIPLPTHYHKLSPKQRFWVRQEYKHQQGGRCWHCGQPLDGPAHPDILNTPITASLFPKGFFTHPVHLHHDHRTGMTVGAVHARCNAVLWQHHGE